MNRRVEVDIVKAAGCSLKEIDIPRYVDSQMQLLFWEIDEAVIFIGCLGAGIAIGGWATIASLVGGWYAVKRFKRFKMALSMAFCSTFAIGPGSCH